MGDVDVELGPVGGESSAVAVEHLDRRAARIALRFHHDRRDGADQGSLGHAAVAVPCDIARDFAATGRVPDMDRVLEIERCDEFGDIGGIGIHVVANERLGGTAVAAPVVGDDPVSLRQEEHHLVVPVVDAERPAVVEDDRLAGAPILVVNFGAVFGDDLAHVFSRFAVGV